MAQSGDYDLILMDIGLPDFSGVEATKKIRALSKRYEKIASAYCCPNRTCWES